jgi:hypothetical protein
MKRIFKTALTCVATIGLLIFGSVKSEAQFNPPPPGSAVQPYASQVQGTNAYPILCSTNSAVTLIGQTNAIPIWRHSGFSYTENYYGTNAAASGAQVIGWQLSTDNTGTNWPTFVSFYTTNSAGPGVTNVVALSLVPNSQADNAAWLRAYSAQNLSTGAAGDTWISNLVVNAFP